MRPLILSLLILVFLAGCSGYKQMVMTTVDGLNARKVQGCLDFSASAGGGIGHTVNGSLNGTVATGGLDPTYCFTEKNGE